MFPTCFTMQTSILEEEDSNTSLRGGSISFIKSTPPRGEIEQPGEVVFFRHWIYTGEGGAEIRVQPEKASTGEESAEFGAQVRVSGFRRQPAPVGDGEGISVVLGRDCRGRARSEAERVRCVVGDHRVIGHRHGLNVPWRGLGVVRRIVNAVRRPLLSLDG